jgi:pilus assembly protein CpaF
MAMRIVDRLAGGKAGEAKSELSDVVGHFHKLVLDRVDHKALALLSPEETSAHLKREIVRLLDIDARDFTRQEQSEIVSTIMDEIMGLGPLEVLLSDPAVSDILVNGPKTIYVERGGRLSQVEAGFRDDAHLINTISRIVGAVGRRVDESSPMVDARLEDGSRVNAIIPPLALDGAALSIRRFGAKALSAEALLKFGAMSQDMLNYLRAAVVAKCNLLISGGTGAGKTTLLNALSNYIPEGERVITLEDSAELQLQLAHTVRLESRPPNLEGRGAITIGDLMKNALRMRPDRIVVGEVRGQEALDMLQAMNTGHEGSMGTLHANTPADATQRLMTMISMGGTKLPPATLEQIIGRTLHVIVQAARLSDGSRRVTSITEVLGYEDGDIKTQEVFTYQRQGMDGDGKVIGEHLYIAESTFLERFYQVGALRRPGE